MGGWSCPDNETMTWDGTLNAKNKLQQAGQNVDDRFVKKSVEFPSETAPSSLVEGDLWNDSIQKHLIGYINSINQGFTGCIFGSGNAGSAVSNTTTETSLVPVTNAQGTLTLPASWAQTGNGIRIRANGKLSSQAVPVTLTIQIKKGSTTLATTGAQTPLGALSGRFWRLDCIIRFQSPTRWHCNSLFEFMTAAQGSTTCWEMINSSFVNVNSNSELIDLTATWGAGVAAADSITCTSMEVEAVNTT